MADVDPKAIGVMMGKLTHNGAQAVTKTTAGVIVLPEDLFPREACQQARTTLLPQANGWTCDMKRTAETWWIT